MPSEDTQFKPGNPGGPGRPPGSISLRTMLKRKLEKAATDRSGNALPGDEPGTTKSYAEALIDATIRDAIKGDASARKLVWEYIDGKAPVDPEGDGEAVVQIVDNI